MQLCYAVIPYISAFYQIPMLYLHKFTFFFFGPKERFLIVLISVDKDSELGVFFGFHLTVLCGVVMCCVFSLACKSCILFCMIGW
jgi:hypothetical protein